MKERLEERFRGAIGAVLRDAGDAGPLPDFTLVASRWFPATRCGMRVYRKRP